MARQRKRRMITLFDAAGANLGSVAAVVGDEARHVPEGGVWKLGRREGRVSQSSGRHVKLKRFSVKRDGNRLTGIPDGTGVIVNDQRREPVDGVVALDVRWDEAVHVQLSHPLYEYCTLSLACTPAGNSGGHVVDQDHARLRTVGYTEAGSITDQLDALWKLMRGIAALLTDEQRAALDPGAIATMEQLAAVKARVPKLGEAT